MKQEQFFFEKYKKHLKTNQQTKKPKKREKVELTPTFARKKGANTNLNKETNQVQSSEARVQRSKGVAMEERRKEQ